MKCVKKNKKQKKTNMRGTGNSTNFDYESTIKWVVCGEKTQKTKLLQCVKKYFEWKHSTNGFII